MQYRDLIPGRLGGSIIASHIRIPDAGPVPDMVHYHTVGFQLIFCYRGWVRLVYEDQGPPFVLGAGDCVIQPPRDSPPRARERPENLQVIEIGVPAEHVTTVDHEMTLPNPRPTARSLFGGQRFCRSEAAKAAVWRRGGCPDSKRATPASAPPRRRARRCRSPATGPVERSDTSARSDILFTFVLSGHRDAGGRRPRRARAREGDALRDSARPATTSLADCVARLSSCWKCRCPRGARPDANQ